MSDLVPARVPSPAPNPADWSVVLRRERHAVLYNSAANTFAVSRRPRRPRLLKDSSEEEDEGHSTSETDEDDLDIEVISQTTSGDLSRSASRAGKSDAAPPKSSRYCPLCGHSLATSSSSTSSTSSAAVTVNTPTVVRRSQQHRLPLTSTAAETVYFNLLSDSLANTPTTTRSGHSTASANEEHAASEERDTKLDSKTTLNTGYFASFFREIRLLGRGGAGSVHHVVHVLNGERLGSFAVKKVAVGDSSHSLLRILREVHLLESLNHPNIVTYHHAWVEHSQLSTYAPAVPTLHILMEYANGGSLDAFINARRGFIAGTDDATASPLERKQRHKMRHLEAVHLLRLDEILTLFGDITSGLAFLHGRNILHLDLKAENVLLHWDEDELLPIAKLSDFGNATSDAFHRERTGGSGTLAYTAPEAWEFDAHTSRLHAPDRASDQWALGLILHLLSFFTLPYREEHDMARLEKEIREYQGFSPSDAAHLDHGTRHDLPPALLQLIARLVHRRPADRLSCDKVLVALKHIQDEGAADPEGLVVGEVKALVRSPSPAASAPLTQLKGTAPVVEVMGASSSSISAVVAASPQSTYNSGLRARQLIAAAAALCKLVTLERMDHSTFPSRTLLYEVMLSTIVDVAWADISVTLSLAVFHLFLLWAVA